MMTQLLTTFLDGIANSSARRSARAAIIQVLSPCIGTWAR